MEASVRRPSQITRPALDPAFDFLRIQEPFTLVIFGASGDLSKRKLIPALYHLQAAGYLPEHPAVVGFSRSPLSDEAYREGMAAALKGQAPSGAPNDIPLLRALYYQAGDAQSAASFVHLNERLTELERTLHLSGNRLFYLAVGPEFFAPIVQHLAEAGLLHAPRGRNWSRVIFEKPYGRDLASARELNARVTAVLDEDQIYRIDHFLGKETVQNILCLRFANSIFEPLFNQKYVDNVQITVAETLGMEGRRGAYYDGAGALRDMVQNHILQLVSLIAMEPPAALDAQAIRDEKVKVLRALVPLTAQEAAVRLIRGQYGPGVQAGQPVKGYLEEEGVRPGSQTETYVALRLELENWRWAGVPFFVRTGKRLAQRYSEIAVQFKQPPLHLFRALSPGYCILPARPETNQLVFRIQPQEGILLSFACKQPGMSIQLEDVTADFLYEQTFAQRSPEAYERLLLDAMRGDASLFTRSDEVDYAWRFVQSIHDHLPESPAVATYAPFGEGPKEARQLMAGTQASWRPLREA